MQSTNISKIYSIYHLLITDYVEGMERIWYLCDEFGHKSFAEYYYQVDLAEYKGFIPENYETTGLVTSSYKNLNPSILGHLHNSVISGMKDQKLLPKMLVIVLDDDLLKAIVDQNDTSSYTWGKVIHWMITDIKRMLGSYKEYLPKKSYRVGEPHIYSSRLHSIKIFGTIPTM